MNSVICSMEFKELAIKGVWEIKVPRYEDNRGVFSEVFRKDHFEKHGLPSEFLQDNQSYSKKGVLRGLHFQRAPHAQGKLVRAITGRIQDVVVDLRPESPTFGKHLSVVLSAAEGNLLFVPGTFAHGFAALEDCLVGYKVTNLYHKDSEGGLMWNDPALSIDWMVEQPLMSEKDLVYAPFKELSIRP
jgi:dTDP-4-dehydrorhamnose 3,5-epimerase